MKPALLVSTMIVALFATGCPDSTAPTKPADKPLCTKVGEACKLTSGTLGICNESPCAAGQAPPCLACIAQH